MRTLIAICIGGIIGINVSFASVHGLLKYYQNEGVGEFSAASGESSWNQENIPANGGKARACSSCHGTDILKPGRHVKTGKVIEPMAPSVNPSRLSELKKIEKWFRRNCRWTFGRECSTQEKGNFLQYLMAQ